MHGVVKFENLIEAAKFIAECVREGVNFDAEERDGKITLSFTGGF